MTAGKWNGRTHATRIVAVFSRFTKIPSFLVIPVADEDSRTRSGRSAVCPVAVGCAGRRSAGDTEAGEGCELPVIGSSGLAGKFLRRFLVL
jgi:hypothetical protein